ncbi:MAG: TetR/AcrR family transcriptional regulator [Thermomicrobiales bacterium]
MSESNKQDWMLPAELESLWDKLEEREPARRRGLSVDAITTAAIELADAEGMDAVSMARIAANLGFATMAIYRHIPNKAALVVLMIDRGIGTPPVIDAAGQGWRASLSAIAYAQVDLYRRRPWLVMLPVSTPPVTPNNLRWMNAMLEALHATPLILSEKLQVLVMLASLIRGLVQLNVDGNDEETAASAFAGAIDRLARGEEYAAVRRAFFEESPADQHPQGTSDVQFALDRLLDGLELLFERRRAEGWPDA